MPDIRILAIDLGTTRCKAGVVDSRGTILSLATRDVRLQTLRGGLIEGTERDWRSTLFSCIHEALQRTGTNRIETISVTAQTASPVCFDRSGHPVGPIISHLDKRAAPQSRLAVRTFPDSYVASKLFANLSWVKDREPETFRRIAKVSDVREYVGYLLTGVLTYDSNWLSGKRIRVIAESLEMDESKFGTGHDYATAIGGVASSAGESSGLRPGTPVLVAPFDGLSCVVGSGLVRSKVLAEVAGTTEVVAAVASQKLSTTSHAIPGLGLFYTSPPLGSPYEWFRKILYSNENKEVQHSTVEREVDALPDGPGKALFVPSFSSVDYTWNITGELLGIDFGSERSQIMKAVMEGITMSVKAIIDRLTEGGVSIQSVRMSGGGSKSEVWNRIRADIYGIPVSLLQTSETGCLGSAVFGAVSLGLYPTLEKACQSMVHVTRTYRPNPLRAKAYGKAYRRFRSAGAQKT